MGPLQGIRVIEMAGIGPGPFCAMMLADMGAEVVRIDRKSRSGWSGAEVEYFQQDRRAVLNRGRRSVAIDLKSPVGRETVLRLAEQTDAFLEGFRPGVMERLGLGPDECLARNPRLVYGRMTGWGQDGPLSQAAGHDINYISLAGVLHYIGDPELGPTPPLNLVGDFGGGGLILAFGMVCALLEARSSGKGQVVDAAMVEGAAALMGVFYGLKTTGHWTNQRGQNHLDGGAHFYTAYRCSDGKYISVGAIEPKFYALLLEKCGFSVQEFEDQMDPAQWPALKAKMAAVFQTRTRDEWRQLLEGTDACFAPVLDLEEAPKHPHNVARKTFLDFEGVVQPAPVPRFSRTAAELQRPPPFPGEHTEETLADWGFSPSELDALRTSGAI